MGLASKRISLGKLRFRQLFSVFNAKLGELGIEIFEGHWLRALQAVVIGEFVQADEIWWEFKACFSVQLYT